METGVLLLLLLLLLLLWVAVQVRAIDAATLFVLVLVLRRLPSAAKRDLPLAMDGWLALAERRLRWAERAIVVGKRSW